MNVKWLIPYFVMGSVFLAVPVLSYTFLDQLFLRRFEDFGHKLFARDVHNFNRGKSIKILQKYENVALVSTDLKGFGLFVGGNVIERFGDVPETMKILDFAPESVLVERVGFFKYLTYMKIPGEDPGAYVFFTLQDDTAILDFLVLVFATLSVSLVVIVTTRRRESMKIEIIQETTILTIRSLAHDFRAPFSKLRNYMSLIESPGKDLSRDHARMREDMMRSFQHVDDLLADFLNIDAGEPAKSFKVSDLLKQIEGLYVDAWRGEFKIDFTVQCDTDLYALGSDKKTQRILFNLLDNAFKHAHSWICVEVQRQNSDLHFCISNDGEVIPKDRIAKIFKPLNSYRSGGLGLGLFICENFARVQRGRVWCTSDESHTAFHLILPIGVDAMSEAVPVPKSVDRKKVRTQTRALAYIEDEYFYQQTLVDSLAGNVFALRVFKNTDEFLLVLRSKNYYPDIVVVDRFGPGFDAVRDRFADSCRDYGFDGPIVLYSNSVTDDQKYEGFSLIIDKARPLSVCDFTQFVERFEECES